MNQVWDTVEEAFHRPASPIHRRVEALVWVLIVVSILLFAQEIAFGRDSGTLSQALDFADWAILLLFAVEVSLRIASYHPQALDFYQLGAGGRLWHHLRGRLRFAMTPLILIDLLTVLAVLPVFRGLRALRLLRLLRTRRIFRYSSPFQGIAKAFEENTLLFGFGFSVFGAAALLGGLSIFLLERGENPNIDSLGDGIWWALVTLTTVGFGDITPLTTQGKVVGGVMMVCGMFTIALFAGIVGQSLMSSVLTIREEQFRMRPYVDHIVLFGYEPGTRMMLEALSGEFDFDETTVVVFAPGERPRGLPPEYHWISGDPTKESELEKVRTRYASAALIVGSREVLPAQADATTILTTFTIRRYLKQNPDATPRARPLYIIAEILDAENVEHARTAGADEVIESTRIGFSLVAHAIRMPGTAALMGRLARADGHSLFVGRLPDDQAVPVRFGELRQHLKKAHSILVLGIRDGKNGMDRLDPPDELVVRAGDCVVYLATRAALSALYS